MLLSQMTTKIDTAAVFFHDKCLTTRKVKKVNLTNVSLVTRVQEDTTIERQKINNKLRLSVTEHDYFYYTVRKY